MVRPTVRRAFCDLGNVRNVNLTPRTHHTTIAVAHVARAAAVAIVRPIASRLGVRLKYGYWGPEPEPGNLREPQNGKLTHSFFEHVATWCSPFAI